MHYLLGFQRMGQWIWVGSVGLGELDLGLVEVDGLWQVGLWIGLDLGQA